MSLLKQRIVTGLRVVGGCEVGKYTVEVDIVLKEDADSAAKQKEKDGFFLKTVNDLTIDGGVSPPLKLRKESVVLCGIAGALRPLKPLMAGQNELEVKKKGCSRHFVLTYNEDDSSGSAEITFTTDTNKFLHQVNIHGVMKNSSSGAGSVGPKKLHVEPVSDGEVSSIGKQLGELKMAEVHPIVRSETGEPEPELGASAQGNTPELKMAEVRPMVRGETGDPPDSQLEASFQGKTAYDKILSNKSLTVIASNLPPSEARLLFVRLGLSETVIKREKEQNGQQLVVWIYSLLHIWKTQTMSQGMTVEKLVASLLTELRDQRQNDLANRIESTINANRELCDDDLNR